MGDESISILDTTVSEPEIAQAVQSQLPLLTFSQYLIIGDEPLDSVQPIDLTSYIPEDSLSSMKQSLRFMPRQLLKDWFDQNIQPLIDSSFYQIMWKSFINVFNKENLDEIGKRGINPWDWEQQKMETLYQAQAQDQIDQNTPDLTLTAQSLFADATNSRRTDLENQYLLLDKIADPDVELNRQAAIKALLDNREYDTVQSIIDAYKNAPDDVKQELATNPNILQNTSTDSSLLPNTSTTVSNNALVSPEITVVNVGATSQANKYANPMIVFFMR